MLTLIDTGGLKDFDPVFIRVNGHGMTISKKKWFWHLPEGMRRRSLRNPCLAGDLPSLPRLCDADATSANSDVCRKPDREQPEKEEEEEKRKSKFPSSASEE